MHVCCACATVMFTNLSCHRYRLITEGRRRYWLIPVWCDSLYEFYFILYFIYWPHLNLINLTTNNKTNSPFRPWLKIIDIHWWTHPGFFRSFRSVRSLFWFCCICDLLRRAVSKNRPWSWSLCDNSYSYPENYFQITNPMQNFALITVEPSKKSFDQVLTIK